MINILNVGDVSDLKAIYEKFAFEYVSVPCVQDGKDLMEVKMALGAQLSSKLQFLAKIDNVVALHHFEKILPDADGIVIVR